MTKQEQDYKAERIVTLMDELFDYVWEHKGCMDLKQARQVARLSKELAALADDAISLLLMACCVARKK